MKAFDDDVFSAIRVTTALICVSGFEWYRFRFRFVQIGLPKGLIEISRRTSTPFNMRVPSGRPRYSKEERITF